MLSQYPRISDFMTELPGEEGTFLRERILDHNYPFWSELEFFLSNLGRFVNHKSVLKRLSASSPSTLDKDKAWGEWKKFRSAQFEIAVIFLIEKYFLGQVEGLIPESNIPTPDFNVRLDQQKVKIEAKAQSGQQHGDKHPSDKRATLFDPKEEKDLKSWLFDEKISSRDRKPMKPMIQQAEVKGADVLVVQTDFVKTVNDIHSQVSVLCPVNNFVGQRIVTNEGKNPIAISFFQVEFPHSRILKNVKEIWLYNLNDLD
jgi:hypothetical protein